MNLKIVLECEKKLYVLTSEPPKAPEANARAAEITSYRKYEDDARDVRCLMLATMTPELQRLHKDMEAHPMMTRLKGLYQGQARHERFKISTTLFSKLKVVGYTDASFQTDRDDSKSQAGYLFCLNGRAFSWKSFKEDTTADSTTEAEYIAAAEAAKEAAWIKKFITELGVVPTDPLTMPLGKLKHEGHTRSMGIRPMPDWP
ncbi:unnamed protein product [Cuscuta campestris]|uniref:Reverse transcriptase Ty1/copia-type domain-containing protein n=1 Tax=Cuscuta campestris TaxID=132261 RepID=A0A484KK01_9ASTE|nr:unnamed protein product [Cuscuta campestris]